ncbi:very-long-chain enoyl-CoA reductase-like isoform X2 [Branchiostoma floridae x Branchiostoma japonicum]
MEIEILHAKSGKQITCLDHVDNYSTVLDLKKWIYKQFPRYYPARQSLRLEPKGRNLSDEETVRSLDLRVGDRKLYLRDLGPQIGWKTVFLCEYSGPIAAYLLFYLRPAFIYGVTKAKTHPVVHIAFACWTFHYVKRVLETQFVHRFSHGTMPIRNLFKNCSYYWGFAAFVSYYINHPLYTPPAYGDLQVYSALAGFVINELGNLSIHLAFMNMRPPGTKTRSIPYPTGNPFTSLFSLVSCPNYTYEVGSWVCFTIMTQCFPALLFTVAGFYQMTVWAIGKHRNYLKEFSNYPRSRKPIIPFLL